MVRKRRGFAALNAEPGEQVTSCLFTHDR